MNLRKESKDPLHASLANKLPSFLEKFKFLIHDSNPIVSFFDVYVGILAIES